MKNIVRMSFSSLLLLALLAYAAPMASAQSFTIEKQSSEASGDLNGYIPVLIKVTNVSGKDLNLRVEITNKSSLPQDWMTQICFFANCFQPNQDLIDGVFPSGEVEDLDITFMTGTTSGQFCVEVTLTNLDNTNEKEVMTFCAAAGVSGVNDNAPTVRGLNMSQNYPNPFSLGNSGVTNITWYQPSTSNVTLKVFNLLGKEVRTLVNGSRTMGKSTVSWDGRDNNNRPVAPGVYIYKLSSNTQSLTRRLMITR
ncbi:T9SS type A sorting domain-containing protein [bacterium]|nr:T9SS type A sorting domain-containing protein [bacterium]